MVAKVPTNGLNHGIPFFTGDTGSIYTHDVSGTDSTAQYNTAYGLTALDAVTTGDDNTVVGYAAGGALTTGANNVIVGKNTAAANAMVGDHNTFVGGGAAYNATDCDRNTIIGRDAGYNLTNGDDNTIIGEEAGKAITTGTHNVFVGKDAGESITTGTHSVFIGPNAGDGHDTETSNIGIGYAALGGAVAGGENNVAVGIYALDALTSADDVVALGYGAGGAITTGSSNCCIGHGAGANLTTGASNVLLGTNAGTAASPANLEDHDNHLVLGHNNITNSLVKVDWTVTSDERDKTDIEPFKMGLGFINELNPVTYRWDMRSNYSDRKPDGTHKKPELSAGLIAQEVEKLEREYGYKAEDKTSVITYVSTDGNYSLTYSKFVPVLINAVQELSAQVTTLQDEINTLKEGK
jgi:hypothetical protein